jgi:multisubunit Na+/H+ antiporter MnhE subunit
VLNYLNKVELAADFESKDVPDVTTISLATNVARTKIHPILYESYMDLIESLETKPQTIAGYVHAIHIHTYDEYKDSKNKEFAEELKRKHFWGEFRLPITPRLGETISIDFIDSNIKYTRGVVTEIHHDIGISCQRIVIYVHPIRNYYWMWEKLKNEHNYYERWIKTIRRE